MTVVARLKVAGLTSYLMFAIAGQQGWAQTQATPACAALQGDVVASVTEQAVKITGAVAQLKDRGARERAGNSASAVKSALGRHCAEEIERAFADLEALDLGKTETAAEIWLAAVHGHAEVAGAIAPGRAGEAYLAAANGFKARWPSLDPIMQGRLAYKAGESFVWEGWRRGDMASIRRGLDVLREQALPLIPAKDYPNDWLQAQNMRNVGLKAVGERTAGPEGLAMLREAVQIGREMQSTVDEQRDPTLWGSMQTNHCLALGALSSQLADGEGLAAIDEAVLACTNALRANGKDQDPARWASAQINLGMTLSSAGRRRGGDQGVPYLMRSRTALEEALTVFASNPKTVEYGMGQTNLGNVLTDLAGTARGDASTALFQQAADAFGAALSSGSDWANNPSTRAMIQTNLGITLATLGERRGSQGMDDLRRAADALRTGLALFDRKGAEREWANAQHTLGNVLVAQGLETSGARGTALLEEARKAYLTALSVRTRTTSPVGFGQTQTGIGNLEKEIAKRGGPGAMAAVQRSMAAFAEALSVYSPANNPADWALVRNNMAWAYVVFAQVDTARMRSHLLEARRAAKDALTVYSAQSMPYFHGILSKLVTDIDAELPKLPAKG